jgi:hypothetical protein
VPPQAARHNPQQHHRDPFDGGYRRVMHRVQCAGEVPVLKAEGRLGHARAKLAA